MNIGTTIRFAVAIIASLAVAFMAHTHASNYLKEQAVDNCARISRYQTTLADQNATVWYPIDDIYKQCLRDKGYSSIADRK